MDPLLVVLPFGDCTSSQPVYIIPGLPPEFLLLFLLFSPYHSTLSYCHMPTLQAYIMTYTAISAAARTGLTSQSRLPVKKALAVAPALKPVSAIARTQSLRHLKVSRPSLPPSLRPSYLSFLTSSFTVATARLERSMPGSRRIHLVKA